MEAKNNYAQYALAPKCPISNVRRPLHYVHSKNTSYLKISRGELKGVGEGGGGGGGFAGILANDVLEKG